MTGVLLALLYTALFIVIIRKHPFFRAEGLTPNAASGAFIAKVCFGFIFWAVYYFHGPYQAKADAFMYFNDGNAIYKALSEDPAGYVKLLLGFDDPSLRPYLDQMGHWERTFNQGLYNETRTVIRFNALVGIFSFGHYHVHTVFMCFVSFLGLTGLYRSVYSFLSDKKKELFAVIFLIPSLLFWGSGVLKEGLILFSVGMIVYYWFGMQKNGVSFSRILFLIAFIILLAFTKLYMLLILLAGLSIYTFLIKTRKVNGYIRLSVILAASAAALWTIARFDVPYMLMEKQRHNYYMARGGGYLGHIETEKFVYIDPSVENRIVYLDDKPGYGKIREGIPYKAWFQQSKHDTEFVSRSADTTTYWVYYDQLPAGSYIRPSLLENNLWSLITHSPGAFITGAFRPHLLEMKNPLMLLSGIENACIVMFILLCFFFCSKNIQHKELLALCIFIPLLLFILIGLTTPILGGVVRYKIPALPFFLIAFLLLLDKQKLLSRFPFLRKILA